MGEYNKKVGVTFNFQMMGASFGKNLSGTQILNLQKKKKKLH